MILCYQSNCCQSLFVYGKGCYVMLSPWGTRVLSSDQHVNNYVIHQHVVML